LVVLDKISSQLLLEILKLSCHLHWSPTFNKEVQSVLAHHSTASILLSLERRMDYLVFPSILYT
jgi:hypothetical protein